ncbi:hypothetical protein K438DRAFT_1766766 [Mycena galopus ATCC 62051]|nr:hypothetical protein K438DRAFT_1766766 [Mycena galopus ATCC 62051]
MKTEKLETLTAPPQRSGSFAIPQSASDIQPVVPPRGHYFFWWMSWGRRSLRNYCELKKEKILTLALHRILRHRDPALTRGKHGRRIPARGAAEGDIFFLVNIDVAGREPVKLNYSTAHRRRYEKRGRKDDPSLLSLA